MNKFYKKWFFPFVIPAIVLFAVVILVPFVIGVINSFSAWRGVYYRGGSNAFEAWVGLDNYIQALQDENFQHALLYTIVFTVVAVIAVNVFALAQALLINAIGRGVGLFRATFFLPNLLGGLAMGYIWLFIYENIFSKMLFGPDGLLPIDALANMTQDRWKNIIAMLIITVWQQSGYMMLIYTTGLANISKDYYEAAQIDGANAVQRFFYVTVPMLMPSFTIVFFMTLSGCFKMLDANVALTNGEFDTRMLALQVMRVPADTSNNYGLAQAEAVLFFLMVAAVSITQVVITKRKEIEA